MAYLTGSIPSAVWIGKLFYKIDVREYGVNPLFICFGFLEWTESSSSDVKRYSPLLCLQVEFDETNKRNKLRIVSAGDEISINHS